MQTLETRKIIEPQGYYLKDVCLTKAGRKKSEGIFWCAYEGWEDVPSFERMINDVEHEATACLQHPILEIEGYEYPLTEGVDYVVEFISIEAFNLQLLAERLNELHEVMEHELNRLGW